MVTLYFMNQILNLQLAVTLPFTGWAIQVLFLEIVNIIMALSRLGSKSKYDVYESIQISRVVGN